MNDQIEQNNQNADNQNAMTAQIEQNNQNAMTAQIEENNNTLRQRRQNTWPLTNELYLFNNVLHILYYDERNILNRPVGISVQIEPFEEPFIYFTEGYTTNHTRSLNNFVYYGRNNDEVNYMRTHILNRTNEARNLLNSILNSYM
jgi:hypothetical protein